MVSKYHFSTIVSRTHIFKPSFFSAFAKSFPTSGRLKLFAVIRGLFVFQSGSRLRSLTACSSSRNMCDKYNDIHSLDVHLAFNGPFDAELTNSMMADIEVLLDYEKYESLLHIFMYAIFALISSTEAQLLGCS
jgi:hypothetical protein